ncbi:MAG: hypothetical protein HC852_07180 [Acaryochloridaceae cyanobacterium RU_4_10]|nr:hypothetical protein [Acaryochloridaceae cyanobacterium RU_4_10]
MIQKTPIIIASTIASLSVCGMAIAVVHQISTEQAQSYPSGEASYPFDRCYPSAFERPASVNQFKVGPVTWWEVRAKSVRFRNGQNLLHFRTEGKKCKWSNRNRPTFRLDYMPKSTAVDFAMQHYKPMLDACKTINRSVKNVKAFCVRDMQKGLQGSIFFPEEVEALTSMKIDVNSIQGSRIISRSENIK